MASFPLACLVFPSFEVVVSVSGLLRGPMECAFLKTQEVFLTMKRMSICGPLHFRMRYFQEKLWGCYGLFQKFSCEC